MTKDKIIIKGLEIHANHGYFPEEKKLGQKFVLDLKLTVDLKAAGTGDDLEQTVHYGLVCQDVQKFFTENTFDLIETCAEKTLEHLMSRYPEIRMGKLTVKKPWAPVGLPLKYAAVSITRQWSRAYIALGSNQGDTHSNISHAVKMIADNHKNKVQALSSLITTEPWGYADQDDFLNGALAIDTLMSPDELLTFLQSIERQLKRVKTVVNGPRTIDLDILLFGDEIICQEDLVIPHPRMQDRMFVLEPLCEIEPYAVHPLYRRRIIELKQELQNQLDR